MKNLVIFMVVLNLFSFHGFAENKNDSSLNISANSFSKDLQIHIVVIDPIGRRNGYIPFPIPQDLNEFPAGYGTIRLGNEEALEQVNNEAVEFNHGPVLKGTYTIIVYGLSSTPFLCEVRTYDSNNQFNMPKPYEFEGYVTNGSTVEYKLNLDPTPGAPPPVLTKVVTFQTLRDDFNVAYKLNQIGDDKFVKSLIRMVDIAEMISKRCDKLKDKAKPKCYRPVVVILRMIVKRLEVVNKLCDQPEKCIAKCKVSKECDEDEALKVFESKYRKDDDLKVFFNSWDKDEWHKHKKKCKRFITDEALEIVSADINWLIKGFGEEVFDNYKKEHEPYIPEKYKNFFK